MVAFLFRALGIRAAVGTMTETQIEPQENLPVDLTIHSFPLTLLQEFAEKIVVSYFGGNLNQAIKSLMEKALIEETLATKATYKP